VAQIRRKIGTYLRKIRNELNLPLDQVVAELTLMNIQCSKSALSRIERDTISCRTDLLAGLCLIYKIDSNEVLFRKYKF
jgi:transcriptional regulator with XRE-family HTH domain